MECRVCGATAEPVGHHELLQRHPVAFYLCPRCDFWFSEEPYWLDEAYADETVSRSDTGSAARSIRHHGALMPLLARRFGTGGKYVDWAGGTGLMARLMRDSGLDFYWQDTYAENLYAKGFEWAKDLAPAAAVTAIEVFEHLPDPVAFVDEVLNATDADTIIFTQELHHGVDWGWWYLAAETGQHIAFYTPRTLAALAGRFGMRALSASSLHMLTRGDLTERQFRRGLRIAPVTRRLAERSMDSRTERDAAAAQRA